MTSRLLVVLAAGTLFLAACSRKNEPNVTEIGQVGSIPQALPLSPDPGAKPDRVAGGSPALVLEVRSNDADKRRWYRLLAADGTFGWTTEAPAALAIATASATGTMQVLDHSPDDAGASPKAIMLGAPAAIVGASRQSSTASPQHLMLAPDSNFLRTPYLKLMAEDKTGWISPYEISLAVTGAVSVQGLVRSPFPIVAPDPAETPAAAIRLNEDGRPAKPGTAGVKQSWNPVNAAVFAGPRAAYVFGSATNAGANPATLLLFENKAEIAHLILDSQSVLLQGARPADLNGDGNPEWLLELGQLSGHGYSSKLWIVSVNGAKVAAAKPSELTTQAGDTPGASASWWFDELQKQLWVARVNEQGAEAERVNWTKAGAAFAKTTAAFAVASQAFDSKAQATAAMLEFNSRLPVFPVVENGKVRWVAGRLFASEKEAHEWQRSVPQFRVVKF